MSTIKGKPKGYFQYILAADCETTGLCFNSDNPAYNPKTGERHQAVSWGFIVADAHTLKPIEDLYLEIKWNDDSLDAREADSTFGRKAESIHGLSLEHLENNGVDEQDAVIEIGELILKYWGDQNIRMLGHNVATFDLHFLRTMFRRYDIELKFGSRHVDTSSVGFVCFETYNSDQLFEECGFEQRKDHNALVDAKYALEAARITRLIFQSVLE